MSIPPVNPDGQSLDYQPVPVTTPQPKLATQHHANPTTQFEQQVLSRPVKQSRDRAQYVRQQKGHSWLLGWIILGPLTCFIVPLYWTFSPNHYWHI